MIIKISRSSVCLADDCFDHTQEFEFPSDATWDEIIPRIKSAKFLASVFGNNVVWVLKNSRSYEVLSFYTYDDTVIKCTTLTTLEEICGNDHSLHFDYFSSPLKRLKYIENVNDNSQYSIWHDGWLEEYQHCEKLSGIEKGVFQ